MNKSHARASAPRSFLARVRSGLARMGAIAFVLFLLKGLAWLIVPLMLIEGCWN
ncbi:MAG: hypothetical protein HRF50_11335 [Phycisphaerae bacterium]|jgi:hypothetical protein